MSEPISESLRTIHRRGVDAFGATGLASDVGPTVRRVARRRVGRVVGAGLAAVALVATVTVGALGYAGRTVSPALPSPAPSSHPSAERLLVTVSDHGDKEHDIAEALAHAGVIDLFQDFVSEATKDPASVMQIAPGQYWLPRGMTARDAIAAMLDPSKRHGPNIRIDPGYTEEQIFRQFDVSLGIPSGELYVAADDPASFGLPAQANGIVEGWLGPYAYYFAPGTTPTQALSAMVEATIAHLDMMGVEPLDRQHVLTVASLVDRVTGLDSERAKVARVIENRIVAGIPLAYNQGFSWTYNPDGTSSPKLDAQGNSPGDTFPYPGLPPAPVCSPSLVSIDAALHPADGPWLYVVTVNPGTGETRYETTLEEYKRDLAELVAWLDSNQGGA